MAKANAAAASNKADKAQVSPFMYVYVCMIYVCTYTHTHVCVCTHAHRHTSTHTHTHTQGTADSLLSRLGDARAGLAWLSAKLGAAKDDTSTEKETSSFWQKKAEKASKRARASEQGEQANLNPKP